MEEKDPFKIDFASGQNLQAETPKETPETVSTPVDGETPAPDPENVKLSRKERRKQRKREKELKKIADRKFEREAGKTGVKRTSLILGIVGFLLSLTPIIVTVALLLFMVTMGLVTAVLFMLFIAGFIIVIPIFLSKGLTISEYFAVATAPVNFASSIYNSVSNIQGIATVILSGAGLVLEIVSLILLIVSYKALCKKNQVKRTVFISIAIPVSAIIFIFALANGF